MPTINKYPFEMKPGDLINLGWGKLCIVLEQEKQSEMAYNLKLLWDCGEISDFELKWYYVMPIYQQTGVAT